MDAAEPQPGLEAPFLPQADEHSYATTSATTPPFPSLEALCQEAWGCSEWHMDRTTDQVQLMQIKNDQVKNSISVEMRWR